MLAGEGLGGVLQALLAIAKVDGSREYQVALRVLCSVDPCVHSVWDGHRVPRSRVLRLKGQHTASLGRTDSAFLLCSWNDELCVTFAMYVRIPFRVFNVTRVVRREISRYEKILRVAMIYMVVHFELGRSSSRTSTFLLQLAVLHNRPALSTSRTARCALPSRPCGNARPRPQR